MASLIQDLETIIKRIDYKIIKHVRRDGNKAADFLANWGSNEQGGKLDSIWSTRLEEPRMDPLKTIITQDYDEDTTSS